MATSIFSKSTKAVAKPLKLSKTICDNPSSVLAIDTFPDNGVIVSLTYDCYILVWVPRSNGLYFPSVKYFLNKVQGKTIQTVAKSRAIFVLLEDNKVLRLILSNDFNSVLSEKYFTVDGITKLSSINFDSVDNLLFFADDSGKFIVINTETDNIICRQFFTPQLKFIQYDSKRKYLFLSDDSTVSLLIENSTPSLNRKIQINSPTSNQSNRYKMFSNFTDPNIGIITCSKYVDPLDSLFISDSKGQVFMLTVKGDMEYTTYCLIGHQETINKIFYLNNLNSLLTVCDSGLIGLWDMGAVRHPSVLWKFDDYCSLCNSPFFWNFSLIFSQKKLGRRRHHCRACGKSICIDCCTKTERVASLGFEIPCFLCNNCFPNYNKDVSFIKYYSVNYKVKHASVFAKQNTMITGDYFFPFYLWKLNF